MPNHVEMLHQVVVAVGVALVGPRMSVAGEMTCDELNRIGIARIANCSASEEPASYTNPVGDEPLPMGDPFVLQHEGKYYLFGTNAANEGFKCWESTDLVHWQPKDWAYRETADSWAVSHYWAPEVAYYREKFYLTYSALGKSSAPNRLLIALAVSDRPEGPYRDLHAPWFDFGYSAIDGHIFVDDDGKPYLYYSRNGAQDGYSYGIMYGVELASDLSSPVGTPVKLMEADQPWEKVRYAENRCNEGAFVLKHDGRYYMTYSANHTGYPTYGIGYASADKPLGLWTKAAENPIAKTDREVGVSGPGHSCITSSPDGKEMFIVYHTHADPERPSGRRVVNIDRIGFDASGKLKMAGPTRSPQPMPSGSRPPEMTWLGKPLRQVLVSILWQPRPLTDELSDLRALLRKELPQEDSDWLRDATRRQLLGCRVKGAGGQWIYTPDGVGNYRALWTRDFAYMVQYAGDLLPPDHVKAGILYLLGGQRADGCMPDRVTVDGRGVYSPGGEQNPLADHALDNGPFMAKLVCSYVQQTEDLELFRTAEPALRKGLDHTRRAANGLVYNPPDAPQCPYGFTDTVAKTGHLLFCSLLYYEACRGMEQYCRRAGCGQPEEYAHRADRIREQLTCLWDDTSGMFLAADQDCRQIDIWGSALAVELACASDRQADRIAAYLVEHYDQIVQRGQVRHLPGNEHWQRTFIPVKPGTYQNGAFWATPVPWVASTIARRNPQLAVRLVKDAIADFQKNGITECVNGSYHNVPQYVVSATNVHGSVRNSR